MADFNSPQKQKVREELWISAFDDLINNEKIQQENLKFLDLPGPECIFIKQIFKKYTNLNPQNLCLIEKDTLVQTAIQINTKYMPLLKGEIEEIFASHEVDNRFPFHILNLDFCGMLYYFPKKKNDPFQKRWNVIFDTLRLNCKLKSYYLLITVISERNNREGMKVVEEQWKNFKDLVETKLKPPTNKIKIAISIPFVILQKAVRYNYTFCFKNFGIMIYSQEHSKHTMLTFKMKLVKEEVDIGSEAVFLNTQIQKLAKTILKSIKEIK